jgi:hypothetical protein
MKRMTPQQARVNSLGAHGLGNSLDNAVASSERLVGLHNTTQSTPYLSLRARLTDFARADLDEAMWQNWELARFRAMRLTMFIFPGDLLEIAAAATRHLTATWAERWLRVSKLDEAAFGRIADDVDAALAGNPMTVRELRVALGVDKTVDLPGIVGRMCDTGRLVGGAPPQSWRSPVRRYHRWEEVLPRVDPYRCDEQAAQVELVRRYVESYGPVTIDDVSWWTGMTKGRCRWAMDRLDLEEVDVDGWPGPLWRFGEATEDAPDSVHALPLLDPYVQGYRDRERLVDSSLFDYVWDRGGNAAATIVHEGRVIGIWQTVDKPKAQILCHFFVAPSSRLRRAAFAELEAASTLYFDKPAEIVELEEMKPLDRGAGAIHPLDGKPHRPRRNE